MFVNQARSWHHKFWNQIFLFTQAIFCTWPKSQDKNLNILWTKRAFIEANKTIFWKVSVRRGHLAHIQDGQKSPLPKTCHTYSTMMKLGTFITYLKKIQKKYVTHVTRPLISTDISIFSLEISNFCYIKKYRYRLHFDTYF